MNDNKFLQKCLEEAEVESADNTEILKFYRFEKITGDGEDCGEEYVVTGSDTDCWETVNLTKFIDR